MRAIALWICCCAYLNAAGWALSGVHQLNPIGYTVTALAGLGALWWWHKINSRSLLPAIPWPAWRRRFRRPPAVIFLFIAILVFLGGIFYAPNNYDGLTYRLPRLLHWLDAGRWFWIPTADERMNYSTTAWEWLALPQLALFHGDRGLFLINALGFLLMPGLIFSIARQWGVARRVAWTWMWIVPLAYGYALQAGGIGNDLPGALFCLMSVACGLRARRSGAVTDVWLATLAAALMTATKLSNLPLLLPCLVAVWPALPRLRDRWRAGIVVIVMATLVSAVPTIVLNLDRTGSWTGDPNNAGHMQIKNPVAATFGNSLLLLQQSLMPPLLPSARTANDLFDKKLPAPWHEYLREHYPRYAGTLNELPQEETSGLGMGISSVLLVGAVASAFFRKKKTTRFCRGPRFLVPAIWLAILVFMAKMGSEATPRLMLPYYPLAILSLLLLTGHEQLLSYRAWRSCLGLAALSVLPGIVLSPARPLWPAPRVSEHLAQQHPDSPAIRRMAAVYATYAHRNDLLAGLRDAIPANVAIIGFCAGDNDSEYSLWKPIGRRHVVYLEPDGPSIRIPDGVEWLVVKERTWRETHDTSLEEWAAQHHAEIVKTASIITLVGWGEEKWFLFHIQKS